MLSNLLERNHRWILFALIPLLGVVLHWNIWTKPLIGVHVWRQAQTQINIENFAFEDFNLFHPRIDDGRGNNGGIQRMEFPIMQWFIAIFYKMFGDHLIISRILSWLIGLFSVWGMYVLFQAVFRRRATAVAGAWAFHFSPLMFYYSLNPLPDNFALCCSIWGMAFFLRWIREGAFRLVVVSAVLLGLGALSKLPFVVFFAPVGFYLLFQAPRTVKVSSMAMYAAGFAPVAAWYAAVIPTWQGNGIVKGMLENSRSWNELAGIVWGHLVSNLPELFINYASVPFFLTGFYWFFKKWQNKQPFAAVFLIWSAAVLFYFFFEINQIGKEHDYYLFPFLPLIFLLVAGGFHGLWEHQSAFWRYYLPLAMLVMPITAYLRVQSRWSEEKPGFNKDLLDHREALRLAVPDSSLCIVGNDVSHHIWFYHLNKKGWAFDNDRIDGQWMADRVRLGAKYLYTDARHLESRDDLRPMLDSLIGTYGSIRVWTLTPPQPEVSR